MSTKDERAYIGAKLMPEIKKAFELWAKEYQQERDLGKLGEFANLYRKARKLKTLIWDEKGPAHPGGWRETERVIVTEVIAHGLLMLVDLDKDNGDFERWLKEYKSDWDDDDDEDEEGSLSRVVKAGHPVRRTKHLQGPVVQPTDRPGSR